MTLSVEEILQLPGLVDMSVRAGAGSLGRLVRWVYVAENEGIAEWIIGGELVFVTGINHPRGEANLLQLVDDGHSMGIAGLVILTGGSFIQRIPQAVIDLAEACGLPLIEQPYLLKMVIVTQVIGTALVHMEQARRSGEDVLSQLLNGDYPSLAIARQRAAHLQLPLEGPRRLVALRLSAIDELFEQHGPDQAEQRLQQRRRAVHDHLQGWNKAQPQPLPMIVQGDLFILLLAEQPALRGQLAALHQALGALAGGLSLYMGLAGTVEGCEGYRQALNEARQALDVALMLRPASGLCDFAELGVLRLLQGITDRSVIDAFVHQTLGSLIEPKRREPYQLLETLQAVLDENGSAVKAAQRLKLHRNTINQRIQRIEQQSGQALDDPLFRMSAAVALFIWRMTDVQEHKTALTGHRLHRSKS